MYSREQTCNTVLDFYRQIIRHPYLDDDALIIPPPQGWNSINNATGKDGTVIDLLYHLPYLRPKDASSQKLIIYYGTIPICYEGGTEQREEVCSLPAYCVYLARRADYLGTDLILDTSNGAVTEYSSDNICIPYEEYEILPDVEKWRAHKTMPVTELLGAWTKRYEELVWMLLPNPIGQPETGRFYSRSNDTDDSNVDYEGGSELDREQRDTFRREREHVANVYDTYICHGWLDRFDKERCRAELLALERVKDAEERQIMDEKNPDAALFD